jgi:hypothetical protein
MSMDNRLSLGCQTMHRALCQHVGDMYDVGDMVKLAIAAAC